MNLRCDESDGREGREGKGREGRGGEGKGGKEERGGEAENNFIPWSTVQCIYYVNIAHFLQAVTAIGSPSI